jgi:hypothetical protein
VKGPVPATGDDEVETPFESIGLEPAVARIRAALEQIIDPETPEEVVLIDADPEANVYLQFSVERDGDVVYGEAVSNAYLAAGAQLSPEQVARLTSLGWHEPDGEDFLNFHREWNARGDLRTIALEGARTLSEVYGIQDLARLEIDVFV